MIKNLNAPTIRQLQEIESTKRLQQQLEANIVQPKLVGSDGQEIAIPKSIFSMLKQTVQLMASGRKNSIVPSNCELTPQESADILNVSRPFFMGLLRDNTISSKKVGTHHRIRLQDVIDYKNVRDRERAGVLDELIQMGEEEGFYDV